MTLIEAFRELAPADGDDATIARRKCAMAIVYQELHSVAGRIWRSAEPEDRKDVASKVFMRLIRNGPRGEREGDPSSDAGVSAYLAKAIRYGLIDSGRDSEKFGAPETLDDYPTDGGPAEEVERREAQREIQEARHQLFDVIVPELAQRSRSGNAFIEAVRQLREIDAGTLRVDELVEAKCGDQRNEAALKRERNSLDKRFGRVRERVDEEITRLTDSGLVTEERARTLKAVLESLRLRK